MYLIENKSLLCGFLISVMLHLVIIIAAGIYFTFSTPPVGIQVSTVLRSYLYETHDDAAKQMELKAPIAQDNSPTIQSLANDLQKAISENNELRTSISKITKRKLLISTARKKSARAESMHKMSQRAQQSEGKPIEKLIALLHERIDQHKHYPMSAQEMGRGGRVTVVFRLNTTGQIENARVQKTSGTSSLDDAALVAVKEASPFLEASSYIKNAQEFSIDVVFQYA